MKVFLFAVLLASALSACHSLPTPQAPSGVQVMDSQAQALFLPDSRLQKLTTGVEWAEGIVYIAGLDGVVFSDVPNNKKYLYTKKDGLKVLMYPSYYSNGHAIDQDGTIIVAEHGRRAISRMNTDGTVSVLVDPINGRRLNSPNDVIVKSDGTIWFSDPKYGILSDEEGHQAKSELSGEYIYRFDPATGDIQAVVTDTERPNGLAFSPNERTLYVSDTSATHKDNGRHEIRAYAVDGVGNVGGGQTLVVVTPGLPDGFKVDKAGRIFTSADDGVHIYSADGKLLAKILVPETVGNLTFGGKNFDELYIAASTSIYHIRLNTQAAVQAVADQRVVLSQLPAQK